MTKYKRIDTKNGRIMYFIDGKMKSVKDLPKGLDKRLENGVELEIGAPTEETLVITPAAELQLKQSQAPIDTSVCVVCGEPATTKRYLMERNVGMCKEHRDTLTTGKVVQAMREKQLI